MSYAGILKGTPYFKGVSLGNTSKVDYSVETETKSLPDYENGGGGLDDEFERVTSARVSCSFRRVSKESLQLAFGATVNVVAAAAVTDEAHTTGALGELVRLAKAQDMAQPMVVTNSAGTTTYVEGTDYTRKRAGIIPISGGAITAAQAIKVDYQGLAHVSVEGLTNLTQEGLFTFDGFNERNNAPFLGDFYRVKFGPAKNVQFIGDDYLSFDCEGAILKDDTKTGAGVSQYYKILVGSL